jgi:hypothetical protein
MNFREFLDEVDYQAIMRDASLGDQLYNILFEKHQAAEEQEEELGFINEEDTYTPRPYDFTEGHYEPYEHDYSKYPEAYRKYEKNFARYEQYRDYFKANPQEYPTFIDHNKEYQSNTHHYTEEKKF